METEKDSGNYDLLGPADQDMYNKIERFVLASSGPLQHTSRGRLDHFRLIGPANPPPPIENAWLCTEQFSITNGSGRLVHDMLLEILDQTPNGTVQLYNGMRLRRERGTQMRSKQHCANSMTNKHISVNENRTTIRKINKHTKQNTKY